MLAVLIVNAQTGVGADSAGMRRWTEAGSQRTIEAEFVELRNGKVCLRRADGKVFELSPEQLSAADRDYVQAVTAFRPDSGKTGPTEARPQQATKIIGDADTPVVIAEGVGTTSDEALREAFRQAVRQVVGTFVSAETLVENDKLVVDKILTFSNGYITTFNKLSETEQNGLVRVTIQAAVQREPLIAKLSEVNVNVTTAPLSGSNLAARLISQTEREEEARALLRDALVGFPHSLIEATSEGEPKIVERSEDKVTISYQVKVAVNIDKYTPFQHRLTQVLERIAKHKGDNTVMKTSDSQRSGHLDQMYRWASYVSSVNSPPPASLRRMEDANRLSFEAAGYFSGPLWPGYGQYWENRDLPLRLDVKTDFVFAVNTGRTRAHDRTTWKWYCVSRLAVASPDQFAQLAHRSSQQKQNVCPDQVRVQIDFLDGTGAAVIADDFDIRQSAPGSSLSLSIGSGLEVQRCTWVISPYIMLSNAYASSVSIPRRLELPLKTLSEIKSVRCTVTEP